VVGNIVWCNCLPLDFQFKAYLCQRKYWRI